MSKALLSIDHLTMRFGGLTAVNDLSFEVRKGEITALIGPNGAGKTTTLKMCLGLTSPDEGRVLAFDHEMPKDALSIKSHLGVVSQFDTLDPDFTCAENLRVYGRYFGLKSAYLEEKIPQLLEFASLSNKANDRPGALSGGMKRRLSLARASTVVSARMPSSVATVNSRVFFFISASTYVSCTLIGNIEPPVTLAKPIVVIRYLKISDAAIVTMAR
mgnify:CR=1 FL=1